MKSKFLHNHPQKEKTLGLDENHVIVDREDWEQARELINGLSKGGCLDSIGIIGHLNLESIICSLSKASIVSYHIAPENLIVAPEIPKHDEWTGWGLSFEGKLAELECTEFARQFLFDFKNERIVNKQELLNSFERMNEQMILSSENIKSLSEDLKAYDRENNPKKKHKGHERPYKFHR